MFLFFQGSEGVFLLSNHLPRQPLFDCMEHVQNFLANMASLAMSEHPLTNHCVESSVQDCSNSIFLPFFRRKKKNLFSPEIFILSGLIIVK